jgi:F-box-like
MRNDIGMYTKLQDDADSAALHNNELSPQVKSTIRTRLSDAERNLIILEDEIARLEFILDGLRTQRAQTIARVQSYRGALASHRKLPDEVLGEIFTCATPIIMLPPKDYWREAPWNITHVCSKWRNIAFATPAIWDNISIMHDTMNSIYHKALPQPIRSPLLRSRHSFIVLNIRKAGLGFAGSSSQVNSVSTVIIPHKDPPNQVSPTFTLYWDHAYQRRPTVVSAVTSFGSLASLCINLPVPAPDIQAIIGYTPFLDTLHLPNGHAFSISTLEKMACGNLIPKLKNLSCMINANTQDAYFDMLDSRRVSTCTDVSTVCFYVLSEGQLNRDVGREECFKNHGWMITFKTTS